MKSIQSETKNHQISSLTQNFKSYFTAASCTFSTTFKILTLPENLFSSQDLKSEYLILIDKISVRFLCIFYLLFRSISDFTMYTKFDGQIRVGYKDEMCFTVDFWQSIHPLLSSTQAEQSCPWEVSWQHFLFISLFYFS